MWGGAELCRRLPSRFKSAFAVDINIPMLEQAAIDLRNLGKTKVLCSTGVKLPFRDNSIGIIMVQGGLHHVRNILEKVLNEISRVLKPNGILIASEPANDSRIIRKVRHWQYSHSELQGDDVDEDGFTQNELVTLLSATDLRMVHYSQFGFIAYPLIGNTDLFPILSKTSCLGLGHVLLAIDKTLEHIPIVKNMGMASIFKACKT